ncbi:MAG: class I SAM-dependent methyltransferase [Vicinamibacterales bacterium]
MKMTGLEKLFVNRAGHSRRVALRMAERLEDLDTRPGQRYLDIGCGTGAAAIHVACAYGLRVTGVDLDPEQVGMAETAARGLGDVTFHLADATCLPFPNACFDVVAMNKTTHHIPGWRAALAEMTRVVRPGGYILYEDLTVPRWMTPLLQPLVGRSAGVFTRHDLDERFRELGLLAVRVSASWGQYDAVFRRREEA